MCYTYYMESDLQVNPMEDSQMAGYMTPAQAAERLQVSRWTILRWIDDERFEGVIKGGFGKTSPNKIPIESVEAVADVLGVQPPDSANGKVVQ